MDDPDAFASVARTALEICHFDPFTGDDKRKAPGAREECEAACYDCLMNYYNQRFHLQLDRQLIRALLLNYARTTVHGSPVVAGRKEHLEQLMRLAGSELERDWLRHLEERNHRLPSHAQRLIENCKTRPDFLLKSYRRRSMLTDHITLSRKASTRHSANGADGRPWIYRHPV